MLKVYDLIQELSKYDADAEVVFKTEMEILIKAGGGEEIEADVRGNMTYIEISQNHRTDNVEIELRY